MKHLRVKDAEPLHTQTIQRYLVYSVNALPVTYLIDRRGRIAATYVGIVDRTNIEANIKALLGER